jgi:EF-hand domain pair
MTRAKISIFFLFFVFLFFVFPLSLLLQFITFFFCCISLTMAELEQLRKQNKDLKDELARLEALMQSVDAEKKASRSHIPLPASDDAKAAAPPSVMDPKEIRRAFDQFDTDKSGFIDRAELAFLADYLGETWDSEELEAAMKAIDSSGDGQISFDEFVAFWTNEDRTTSSKTTATLAALRGRLLAEAAMNVMPSLMRHLSDHTNDGKNDDEQLMEVHSVVSIGDIQDPQSYLRLNIGFNNSDTDIATRCPGAGVVVRLDLEPQDGQSAEERSAGAEAVFNAIAAVSPLPLGSSATAINADGADVTKIYFGDSTKPDPLALAAQLNLDLNSYFQQLSFFVELQHTISDFINPGTPAPGCLASMAKLRIGADVKVSKELVRTLAVHPMFGKKAREAMPVTMLNLVRFAIQLGDLEEYVRAWSDSAQMEDPLVEVQRVQQIQLQQMAEMGVDAEIIDHVRQEQMMQLEAMRNMAQMPFLNPQFYLGTQFKDTLSGMTEAAMAGIIGSAPDQFAPLVFALKENFTQLKGITLMTPSGLEVAIDINNLIDFELLPGVAQIDGNWQVGGE